MEGINYISSVEAAANWQVSVRWVQKLCGQGRIPGVQKLGNAWLLPAGTEKPADLRAPEKPAQSRLSYEFLRFAEVTSLPLPAKNPDSILDIVKEARARLQYEAELAYLRGDFTRVTACFNKTEGDDPARLRGCVTAVAAAISTGDYQTYIKIEDYLKECIRTCTDRRLTAAAELSLASAAMGCMAPGMAPEWLIEGDLSAFSLPVKPYALYLRAKYMQCTSRPEAMLALAQTALTLCEPESGISQVGLYLQLCCAIACLSLERYEKALHYLREAMSIALPHGFISPFAECVTAFGGLMERCLEQYFPGWHAVVLTQWKNTFQNWVAFHNQFTKDNLTLVLTLREYHIAQMVARRIPYAKIAKQQCLSVGRVKNIMLEVYEKLFISGREELNKYVF